VYKSHWGKVHCTNFRVIALCYFLLKFCVKHISVTTKDTAWYFIGRYTFMSGSVLHKNHFSALCFCYTWNVVYCTLHINEIHNSHTPFPKFLHLPSINKTCSAGDINSTNLLVSPLPVFTPEVTIGLLFVHPSVRPLVRQSVSQSVSQFVSLSVR